VSLGRDELDAILAAPGPGTIGFIPLEQDGEGDPAANKASLSDSPEPAAAVPPKPASLPSPPVIMAPAYSTLEAIQDLASLCPAGKSQFSPGFRKIGARIKNFLSAHKDRNLFIAFAKADKRSNRDKQIKLYGQIIFSLAQTLADPQYQAARERVYYLERFFGQNNMNYIVQIRKIIQRLGDLHPVIQSLREKIYPGGDVQGEPKKITERDKYLTAIFTFVGMLVNGNQKYVAEFDEIRVGSRGRERRKSKDIKMQKELALEQELEKNPATGGGIAQNEEAALISMRVRAAQKQRKLSWKLRGSFFDKSEPIRKRKPSWKLGESFFNKKARPQSAATAASVPSETKHPNQTPQVEAPPPTPMLPQTPLPTTTSARLSSEAPLAVPISGWSLAPARLFSPQQTDLIPFNWPTPAIASSAPVSRKR